MTTYPTYLNGAVDVTDSEKAGKIEEKKFRKRRNKLTASHQNVNTRRPAIYTHKSYT